VKKLTLLPTEAPKTKSKISNFWSCCPISYKTLPESPCLHGKPNFKSKRNEFEPTCPWWINSEKHHFCFWKYIYSNSAADGSMKELQLSEIAKLFSWSSTKAHFILKEAMDEFTSVLSARGIDLEDLEDELQELINTRGDFSTVDPE
jgi:hypothetical protein